MSVSRARAVFVGLLLATLLGIAGTALLDSGTYGLPESGTGTFQDASSLTVVTGDSIVPSNEQGPKKTADLVVVDGEGTVRYRNSTYDKYWDVDPVPGTDYTVLYSATIDLGPCRDGLRCARDRVVVHNLSTDETTILYEQVDAGNEGYRVHDVDRLPNGDLIVADIATDRVYRVNATTREAVWVWNASDDFAASSGGPVPDDWTHVNDVEKLPDGEVMISLRNQDQVVFLDPETGELTNRTLGADDETSVLYEQHNPDYIPRARGGPAVLVADSQNNRIVEFQRTDGDWTKSWCYTDDQMLWPRDADRLPSGNVLVTDSNSNRVFEVTPDGEVTWQFDVAFPYEAERLGTGDESAGGNAATAIDGGDATCQSGLLGSLNHVAPKKLNGLVYSLPPWVSTLQVALALVWLLTFVAWTVAENRWES
jgi:hypothetical protein